MNGIFITMEKEELASLVQTAVQSALVSANLAKDPSEEGEDLMTAKEVCAWLDYKESTLYQKTSRKEIPFIKKGGRIYFSKAALGEWLLQGRQYTRHEQNRMADEKLSKLHAKKI